MRLLVMNPNTSAAMTEDIRVTVDKIRMPGVEVEVACPDFGPEALESFYDYSLASFGVCRFLENAKEKYDGVMIACFGDPGLYAIKELCQCPVLGIAETSMAVSLLLGSRFAILAASDKAVSMMENMVDQYGMGYRCAGVFPLSMSVLDAEENSDKTIQRLIEEGRKAMEHGAEVLILGCAGMTGYSEPVSKALGIPVLDPVEVTFLQLEMLCRGGYNTSEAGLYKTPDLKNIKNKKLLEDNF